MTKKLNKRGFTIVELVVVIVVIAILAAVLIPTVSSLIDKANQSADTSAVRQMNEQLAITEVEGKPATISEAIKALLGVNIKLENYTPLATNTQFYWVKSLNRVVYVNIEGGNEEIIYPKDLQDLTHENGDWYSLNGDIEFVDYDDNITTETDGSKSVSIASAGQFAKLVNDKASGVSTIKLDSDIDLAGATAKFTATGTGADKGFAQTITIDGGNKTIYGLRDDTQTAFGSGEYANKGYGYGLFGNIGKDAKVTIKNVVFDGITVEDTASAVSGTAGLIAGYIYGTLKLENVTFKNCSVTAYQKVGVICGQLHGTLEMTNVKFEDCVVSGNLEVAKVAGTVMGWTGKLSTSGCDFDGITTEYSRNGADGYITMSDFVTPLVGDSENVFGYWNVLKKYDKIMLLGVVTNDLAWYHTDNVESYSTKNGETYSLNAWVNSTSNDIENSVSKNN